MHIEFNPNFGYKFIKIGYCTKNEFLDKFSLFSDLFNIYESKFILVPINLSNLFYLSFDQTENIWKLFHSMNNESVISDIEIWVNSVENLEKDFIYIFEYDQIIKNLCVFDKKQNKYSFKKSKINYLANDKHKFTNLLYISSDQIIFLNSYSFKDLFLSCIVYSNSISDTNNIIDVLSSTCYKFFFDEIIYNLQNNIKCLINLAPNNAYSQIFTELKYSDPVFYNKKFVTFTSNIFNILDSSYGDGKLNQILVNLISGFKHDFIIELNNLYHRFRCYPNERLFMYKKMPNHPYTLLIKEIHYYYSSNGKKINTKEIQNIFTEKLNSNENHKILYLIIQAIFQRSEYMSKYHEIYCTTLWSDKKPKYVFNNFFPFNIFSSNLFILEHITLLQ
ncbi:hypothetical protein ma344 [Moumouvirus australiensis]|uniref:Uncharacterized protein n=1 Tax=Moumouvirus australiensis TaxID=2109587 RepID=A0A2P1ELG0_9VIRU|nr:hypothetical protein QKC55_gp561 [Moumouvirus australiensis]AVL94730.1 hypothetical protein ma344 [Moumouvirus australiensis]